MGNLCLNFWLCKVFVLELEAGTVHNSLKKCNACGFMTGERRESRVNIENIKPSKCTKKKLHSRCEISSSLSEGRSPKLNHQTRCSRTTGLSVSKDVGTALSAE